MSHNQRPQLGAVLYSADQIQQRVRELAQEISRDYAGKPLHLLAVLRGAVPFMADLSRYLTLDVTFDFLSVTRQRETNHVRLLKDLDSLVEGRHILLVEDIINEGETLSYLLKTLSLRRHQYGIDCHAYHHQECLERQGKKPPEIIGPDLSPFAVGHSSKWNRGD